jgi:Undecaprenyl-phosphate glucose phosphotransferase
MLTATLARGRVGDASAFARQNGIDLVLVALPAVAEARISAVLHQVNDLAVDVCLAAGSSRLRYRPRTYTWIGGLPFIALADKPIADWASVQKLVFDKTVAALALTLLAPLMALTALAIRIESKGPVLFRQKRLGFDNEPIEIFKFRSMYVDRCDSDARQLVSKGDPRVTGVGRIIRKTSIDELPQLFNVLMGTLSLVGPRPHALHAKAADTLYHDAVEDYFARHRVKPGVTGWAQIHGWRGETDTLEKISKRVEHDLYYIDNWSIGLDIYILLRTPLALLNTESAY